MMSRGFVLGVGAGARRSLVLLWTAVFLCSLLLQYVAAAAPAPTLAVHDDGLFELDGNVENQAAPGDDWNAVYGGSDAAFESLFIQDQINGGSPGNKDKYFDGGSTKDITDISSWLWTTVSQPQDKNDIASAYAAAYRDSGNLIVYFGLDRYAANGAAQVGFWFLKGSFGLTGGPSTGAFSGTHTNGDVLVQIDFENGGANPVMRVYEWNNGLVQVSTGGSCATAASGDTRCAIAATSPTDPAWPFDDKGTPGTSNDIPAGGMVEGGIDLTALNLDDGCFASFVAETRSSPSPSSTLSDFAYGSFALCDKPDISTHVRQDGENVSVINRGESVYDHAVLTGDRGTVQGSVKFFVCRDGSANPDCSTGGDQVGGSVDLVDGKANSAEFTPTQLGYYCFRVEYTPAAGSKYLADSHTNRTTECFRVIPADVRIQKAAGQASVSAGAPISFTLSWGNVGEGKATGVVVSDNLPGNAGLDWSIDSFTGSGSTCAIAGTPGAEVLTCNVGSINGNTPASGSVTLVSGTTPASCGPVDNTGSITSANDGSGSASASVTVLCPDIAVTKLPDDGAINAGDTATFTIKVENLGPGTATGVVLTDTLPAGFAWTEDEADCAIAAGVLTCTVGTLADGASKTYTVSAPTGKDDCGVIENAASASATNEPASNDGNNRDTGAITVRCAVIEVEKTADAETVNAGDPIGFTITIRNTGDGTAYGVTASDALDPAFTWSLAAPVDGWTLAGNQLGYSAASLAAGASTSVHVTAPTTPADCRVVPNTATAAAANDGSDSDDAQTTILCPDVTVTKTAVTGTVSAGDPIAFDITVTNLGPGVAYGVTLTDTLPAGLAWSEDSAACEITAGVLACDFGDLAVDGSATVRVSGVTSNANCGVVSNTAVVAATNEAPAQGDNNSSTDDVQVDCPDIAVTKIADATPISAGDQASFTITVTNLGPGTAYGVTLSDTLPPGITWSEDSAACEITAGVLACDFGTLAEGTSRAVTIVGATTAAQCGQLPNTATVAATNEAPGNAANNESTAIIEVRCPDIAVTKTAAASPISAGDEASFTITVTNLGPGVAYDVTLTDTLPAGIAWSEDSAACEITAGVLACDFGTLQPGASRQVTLTGDTTVDACGELYNLASASAANEPSGALGNNADDATIVVDCPEVVITKTALDDRVNAGDPIAFDIVVTNRGDGSAYGVTVSDVLPVVAGVSFAIDAAHSDAGWSLSSGTLSFGPATLASGASTRVRIVGSTTAASCTTIPNVASLVFEGGTGSDDDAIVVDCPDVTISKTADNSPILAGELASFTISAWNEGPGTAYDVVITDELPAGVAWTEDSEACSITGGVLTCEVGTLDEETVFTVVVSGPTDPDDCGTLDNLAAVAASNEPQGRQGNNEDGATVDVQCASIRLVKTAGSAADGAQLVLEEPGDVTFTYLVTNTGTARLVAISLVDDNGTPADPSDDVTVTCPATTLEPGASMTCTATLAVDFGTRINIAVVTAEPEIAPETEVTDDDDAVVFVLEPVVTPTPTPEPTATPRITPPPTSTLDPTERSGGAGSGLLLVLLSLAGITLALGYLVPSRARSRRRIGRG